MSAIFGSIYCEKYRDNIEKLQWDLAKKLLKNDSDVILDNGFWTRKKREYIRFESEKIGVSIKFYLMQVSDSEIRTRITKRNLKLPPNTFHISEADIEACIRMFEPPCSSEIDQCSWTKIDNEQQSQSTR